MSTNRALTEALRESVMQIDERCDGYRVKLVGLLMQSVGAQARYAAPGPRRQEIETAISALADLVASERGAGEEPA
jgi:hypothetical protein